MELEPKKILILNLGKINNLVTYDEKKLLEGYWDEICPDCVEFEKRLKVKGKINV